MSHILSCKNIPRSSPVPVRRLLSRGKKYTFSARCVPFSYCLIPGVKIIVIMVLENLKDVWDVLTSSSYAV